MVRNFTLGVAVVLGLFTANADAREIDVQTFAIAWAHSDDNVVRPLDQQKPQPLIDAQ